MKEVHEAYWYKVADIFVSVVLQEFGLDHGLKTVTQWRRIPWGNRSGKSITQFVVAEKVRNKKLPNSKSFLLGPDFEVSLTPRAADGAVKIGSDNDPKVLAAIQDLCRQEWGSEYPKPVAYEWRNTGSYCINFQNDEHDKHPATFVFGQNRTINFRGEQQISDLKFLPDGMTADEIVKHCIERFNPIVDADTTTNDAVKDTEPPSSEPDDQGETQSVRQGFDLEYLAQRSPSWVSRIRLPTHGVDREELKRLSRRKLSDLIYRRDSNRDTLVKGPEGLGKTTAYYPILANKAWDENQGTGSNRFSAIACRSYEQAEDKLSEYLRQKTYPEQGGQLIKGFNRHYQEAYKRNGLDPLDADDDVSDLNEFLERIKCEQPEVYSDMLAEKEKFWTGCRFDAAATLLFTAHAMAATFNRSIWNRAWYHPDFYPGNENYHDLAQEMKISNVLHDEVEKDSILSIIPRPLGDFIRALQQEHSDWEYLPRAKKVGIHRSRARDLNGRTFEQLEELMRTDFSALSIQKVDFTAIPYGTDNKPSGLYGRTSGLEFYLGLKTHFFDDSVRWIFLTTEEVPARILTELYARANRNLPTITLDDIPELFPIRIPVQIDPRAATSRKNALVRDLNARGYEVIADKAVEAINFQSMKGRNDLSDSDLAIVPNFLHPDEYAQLNAIGVWLNIPEITSLHHQDQINQAVGRSKGFRDRGKRVVVICTNKFWKSELSKLKGSRVQLYIKSGRSTADSWKGLLTSLSDRPNKMAE